MEFRIRAPVRRWISGPLLLIAQPQHPFLHLLIFQNKAIAREMLSSPKAIAKPGTTAGHRQGAVKEKRNHSEQESHENWRWFYVVCLCPGHFHKELNYLEHSCLSTLGTSLPSLSLPSLPEASPHPCPPAQGPISAQPGAISPCPSFPGGVPISRSATALPPWGHRAGWSSPCSGWLQETKHLPQVGQEHPQAQCDTSRWQKPPSKPTPASALKLGAEMQSCTATATMFQPKCKKKPKAFPPALSATVTGLTSASCSQSDTWLCYIFPGRCQVSPTLSSASPMAGWQDGEGQPWRPWDVSPHFHLHHPLFTCCQWQRVTLWGCLHLRPAQLPFKGWGRTAR